MNKGAIKYARSGILREELINQFSYTRKQLVDEIERIPTDNFYNDFQIGIKKVRLNHYFSSLIHHDLKHKEEIIQFLIHNPVYNKTANIRNEFLAVFIILSKLFTFFCPFFNDEV